MKIIALQGVANTGKTTTLKLLDQKLRQERFIPVAGMRRGTTGDFSDIFIAPDGRRIGITSSGDTHDMVRENLERLIQENCVICVCACRTYDRMPPGTVAAVDSFPSHPATFIDKTRESDSSLYDSANRTDVDTIYASL